MMPPASHGSASLLVAGQEMLAEECRDVAIARHTVLELEDIVALVLKHQVAHITTERRETGDQISRLVFDDARIVATLDD
jgi:hypothetical protein